MKKLLTIFLLFQFLLCISCKGKNSDLNSNSKIDSNSCKVEEWERLTMKDGDTIALSTCNANNLEIKKISNKISIEYGQEEGTFEIIDTKVNRDTIIYYTQNNFLIKYLPLSINLSQWIIPYDSDIYITMLCATKGIYEAEKQPLIYCQDLKDIRDIVDAKDLKKEVTIINIDDFIKTKYPSSSFHIIKQLIADANGDGIPDYIYAIHFNGNGVPQNQEEILLVLLTIDDKHFEVAVDRSDIISAATTILDVKNGTIYFQNEMFSSRDKLGFNYMYNKDIDDWKLTYVNESYDYSDFVKNYDLSSYRNKTLKYEDEK